MLSSRIMTGLQWFQESMCPTWSGFQVLFFKKKKCFLDVTVSIVHPICSWCGKEFVTLNPIPHHIPPVGSQTENWQNFDTIILNQAFWSIFGVFHPRCTRFTAPFMFHGWGPEGCVLLWGSHLSCRPRGRGASISIGRAAPRNIEKHSNYGLYMTISIYIPRISGEPMVKLCQLFQFWTSNLV